MKLWKLEYFSIGTGTHLYGLWEGMPSLEQICQAADVSEDIAWRIVDDKDEDYSLYEIEIPKGMF